MVSRTKGAVRRIGDAVVEIEFTGRVVAERWVYRGCVKASSAIVTLRADGTAEREPVVWRFDDLQTGVGGVPGGRRGKQVGASGRRNLRGEP